MMSVVMATFTVYFTYKLAKKATGNPFGGVLAAFFLSNTLMFVFMSGGISYDNLMYLASSAAIYHLVCVYNKEDLVKHTALTGIWVIVGALAKEQFLLLTLIIFLAWLYFIVRNMRKTKLVFSKNNYIIAIIFILFLGLFISLYGQNLIRYGKPTPSCAQFKDVNTCSSYSYRYKFYQPFNLQWLWFVRDNISNPIKYGITYWGYKMAQSTWGILSHNTFSPALSVSLHCILSILVLFSAIRNWKITFRIGNLLLMIVIFYTSYVFLWNYSTEVKFSFQHYGVTGRYLLPIMSTFVTITTFVIFKIKHYYIKRFMVILSILIYFSGGMGLFLSRYANIFSHWRIYYFQ